MPSKTAAFYKANFIPLFIKKQNKTTFTSGEKLLYDRILYVCNLDQLLRWESEALEILSRKNKAPKNWLSFFSGKEQAVEETKILVVDAPSEKWEIQIGFNCALIEMKLATYNSARLLDQSQVLIIRRVCVALILNHAYTSLSIANEGLSLIYSEQDIEKTILNIIGEEGENAIELRYASYTDLNRPTEIVYFTPVVQATIDLRCISHLVNFISIRELNAEYEKEIIDNLKSIQESAKIGISDMFYYNKTYTINIQLPNVTVTMDAQNRAFYLKMHNFHIIDERNTEKDSSYQVLKVGVDIEMLYHEMCIFPLFSLNFLINTLPKKFLKRKWESLESSFDEYYDLEIVGEIDKVIGNIYPIVIEELEFMKKNFKIEGSRESVLLDKEKIMENCELTSAVVCDFGFVQRRCIAVLSGTKVYFFHKHESLGPFDYIIIEGSDIVRQDQNICIKHKLKTVKIDFENGEQYRWFHFLFGKAGIVKALRSKFKYPEKKIFSYKFMIKSSKVNMMALNNAIEYKLRFDNQKLQIDLNRYVKSMILHIPKIKIKESNNKLIFSCQNSESSEPILIEYIRPQSKLYKGFDINVRLGFSNPRIFVNNTTVKKLLEASKKSPKKSQELLEDNTKEVMIKAQCSLSVTQLEITLEKQGTSQGKFSFDYFGGQVDYQQSTVTASVLLSKVELLWKDNCSLIHIPVFSNQSNEPYKVELKYTRGCLWINTVIPSPHIVYVPAVVAKMQKYIESLKRESKEMEVQDKKQKTTLQVNAAVFVSEIRIIAKREYFRGTGMEIAIESIGLDMVTNDKTNLRVANLICITDHTVIEKSSISISKIKNKHLLKIQSLNLLLEENDYELIYDLIKIPKEKSNSLRILPSSALKNPTHISKSEVSYEILIDFSTITLSSKCEHLNIYFCDLRFDYNSVIGISAAQLNLTNFTVLFQDEPILEMSSRVYDCLPLIASNSDIEQSKYSIEIQQLKIIYNVASIEFIIKLSSNLANLQKSEKTESYARKKIVTVASININEFDLVINSDRQSARISQEIAIQYKNNPFSISIDTKNTSIWRERCLMNHANLSLIIEYTTSYIYLLKFNELNLNLCLDDLLYFKNFFSKSLPSKPPKTSPKIKPSSISTFNILFYTLKINFLSNKLDPIIEAILEGSECSGSYQSSFAFFLNFVLSLNYYNPILQVSESLLEPILFSLCLSSDPIPSLKLETPESDSLNINLTDFLIKHLLSILRPTSQSASAFSVHNNTGCTLLLDSTNGFSEVILDGETKNFQPPSESTQLGCTVFIDESFRPSLSRIPLFSQDPQVHQLDSTRDIDILTEARIVNFTKVLKISSPVEILNSTQLDLNIVFMENNEVKNLKVSRVNSRISVPLDCAKCKIVIVPEGVDMEMCECVEIENIKKGLGKIESGGNHFNIDYSNNTLEISPTLVIFNYLPQPICMELIGSQMQLYTGARNTFYISTAHALKSTFMIDGYQACSSIILFSKTLPDKISFHGEVQLEVGLSWLPDQCTLIFYPLVMLTNLSFLPLEFHVVLKNSMPSISDRGDGLRVVCSPLDSIVVRINTEFSSPVNISNKATGIFEVPGSNNNNYELVYNVTKVKIPNQYLFTNEITFNSKILITNCMENDLQALQFGANQSEFIHVQAGNSSYFNWATKALEQYMIIKPIGVYSGWSGAFKIDMPTTFYIRSNSKIVQMFIKIEVKEERDITHVIFYNSRKSDMMIVNKSHEAVEYYQEDNAGYTGTTFQKIEAGDSNYFAWNSQVDKNILVVQVFSNMDTYSYRVNFDNLHELHTFTYGEYKDKLYLKVCKQANTLVLTISETEYKDDGESVLSSLEISIPRMVFSIIQQQIYKKKEILLISFENFTLLLNKCKHHIFWEMLIRDMQVDCQIHEYVVCPTILYSEGSGDIILQGKLVISDKWYCLEGVSCALKNLVARVDSNSIEAVLKFVNQFRSDKSETENYLPPSEKLLANKKAYVYISSLEISSFSVDFSFKMLPDSFKDTFKAYLINFDSIHVTLNDTYFVNLYGSLSSLFYTIHNRYYKMIREKIPEILKQHGVFGYFLSLTGQASKLMGRSKTMRQPKTRHRLLNESLGSWDFFDSMLKGRMQEGSDSAGSLRRNPGKKSKGTIDYMLDYISDPLSTSVAAIKSKKHDVDKKKNENIAKLPKRVPRVFYGKLGGIRSFDDIDCCAANLLIEKNIKYASFSYYGQAISKDSTGDTLIFVLFSRKIAVISFSQRKPVWKIDPLFLEHLQVSENYIVFTGTSKNNKRIQSEFLLQDPEAVRRIERLVAWIRKDLQT